jgi:hypothetical protein
MKSTGSSGKRSRQGLMGKTLRQRRIIAPLETAPSERWDIEDSLTHSQLTFLPVATAGFIHEFNDIQSFNQHKGALQMQSPHQKFEKTFPAHRNSQSKLKRATLNAWEGLLLRLDLVSAPSVQANIRWPSRRSQNALIQATELRLQAHVPMTQPARAEKSGRGD